MRRDAVTLQQQTTTQDSNRHKGAKGARGLYGGAPGYSTGPPPPGVDPEFDALVEAEVAWRRAKQAEKPVALSSSTRAAEPPAKGADPVFDALVEAELERQRKDVESSAFSIRGQRPDKPLREATDLWGARDGLGQMPPQEQYASSRDAHDDGSHQYAYPAQYDRRPWADGTEPSLLQKPQNGGLVNGSRKQEYSPQLNQSRQPDHGSPLQGQHDPRKSEWDLNWPEQPDSSRSQAAQLGLGSLGMNRDPYERAPLGRGMATLQGAQRPAHFGGRREAQAAYAAELRRQVEEKRDREKRTRESEILASRERLMHVGAIPEYPPPAEATEVTHNVAPPNGCFVCRDPVALDSARYQQKIADKRHVTAARSRFVQDVYGETKVSGALGGSVHQLSPANRTTHNRADYEAKRRAQALEQRAALEAQIEERRAMKAREEAERRAEEERELRERERFEAMEKARREAEDTKRKADEQRRFDDLLAAQEAATARRKHADARHRRYRDESPPKVAEKIPAQMSAKATGDAALDAAATQFEAAVAAEVRRLRGEKAALAAERSPVSTDSRKTPPASSLAALAMRYDHDDPNSLSYLARGKSSTPSQPNMIPNSTTAPVVRSPPNSCSQSLRDPDDAWGEKSLACASNFVPIDATPFHDTHVYANEDVVSHCRSEDEVEELVARWQRTHPVATRHKTPVPITHTPRNHLQLNHELSLYGDSQFQQPSSLEPPSACQTRLNHADSSPSLECTPSVPSSPPTDVEPPPVVDDDPTDTKRHRGTEWEKSHAQVGVDQRHRAPSLTQVPAPAAPPEASPMNGLDPRSESFVDVA